MVNKRWELLVNLLFLSPLIIGLAVALLIPVVRTFLHWIR